MKEIRGVVVAVVEDLTDPQGEGRIKVRYPWLEGGPQSAWAPVATPFAGRNRGAWWMPELGDECLVAFEQGDFDHPFVVGFLWNGVDVPPASDPRRRLFHSLNGHQIEIYDPDPSSGDRGYILIKDAHGNQVELSNAQINIRGVGIIQIQAPNVVIQGRVVAPVGPPI